MKRDDFLELRRKDKVRSNSKIRKITVFPIAVNNLKSNISRRAKLAAAVAVAVMDQTKALEAVHSKNRSNFETFHSKLAWRYQS